MDAQLRQLQSPGWAGSFKFSWFVTEWRTQQRVEESLRSIRDAMQHAGQQYESTEQANAAMFRG